MLPNFGFEDIANKGFIDSASVDGSTNIHAIDDFSGKGVMCVSMQASSAELSKA